ncbi:pyridoxal-phosphate dependent enzyme [Marinobacterium sedimentorum]|uniref:pyridoxal-phosphate dependent enzyme n=1 Tax=Marinobacterium sedimentorum TaxID=2927804 RepID=UPI0020C60F4A|nr:pyridoxal-phosphate dependent enzyme [Marinobacterium sedimentorum]MCP8690266.1 pyridoxal-phosphate dependent enzyme [Marinobacterium sedimentorum]
MGTRFDNILGTIGRTPVVRINKLAPPGVNLFVKLEAFNPMGSVKDRLALGVIEDAERRGTLKPGQTVIEATSGNTGIGLAMVCAQKGYPLVVTMAENFSVERRRMMRFLGAQVVLTPAAEKGSGMLAKAVELAREHGWFLCRQFENEANADIHSRTTAVEILEDFSDIQLDYWVTGFGTGGTLKGVARVLREKSPHTRILVCEPDNSPLLGSGVNQARATDGAPSSSHPSFRPHLMQGWTPDFISRLTEDAVTQGLIDQLLPIPGEEALRLSRELASREGIFCGISAGATLAGGLQICQGSPAGTNVLCMLPDTGERYLSTPLFADIETEMTAQELDISRSTPGYRFDRPSTPAPSAVSAPVATTVDAETFVAKVLSDPDKPVVMFALEWCEFCWSLRKLFAKCGIDYRSVDLDSAQYQQDNRGGEIRAALSAHTGCVTIPQIFVGGEFVGGCTEVFDEYREGRLQQRLQQAAVPYDQGVELDPYSLLPSWLHPR